VEYDNHGTIFIYRAGAGGGNWERSERDAHGFAVLRVNGGGAIHC